MPLDWQPVHIPLAGGLDTEGNPQARAAGGLDIARNVENERPGGLQTRHPFASIGVNILGGGTLSGIRKLTVYGDELVAFTSDALYSWSVRDSAWALRGTHLAAKITERSVFVNPAEQHSHERAELSGVVFSAWVESGTTDVVYVAARDKTTDAVLLSPTAFATGFGDTRPRLTVLTSVVLLTWSSEDALGAWSLFGKALDPTNLAAITGPSGATTIQGTTFNLNYDVVAAGGVAYIATRRATTTSYTLISVTAAMTVASVTKARTCDGGIALAAAPSGTHLQVIRTSAGNVQGDYVTIAGPFTDVTTGQAVGTGSATIATVAAAYRSVQNGGQYRCYAFWQTKSNYVDTGGTIGTQGTHVLQTSIGSRAFDHGGAVYVWRSFDETSVFVGGSVEGLRSALQNTYFLYRDDAFLVAKAVKHRSGGDPVESGILPNVQSLGSSVYAFGGVERRVVPIGQKQSGYSARAPRDVFVTFDSNEARRCVQLGRTLYIAGGEVLQYDGQLLTEAGFHLYPWTFAATELSTSGAVEDGDYTLKVTWRWDNAKGERDRSTTATHGTVNINSGPNSIAITAWQALAVTHKGDAPAVEVWRTLKNPAVDAPFYLVTSQDPAVLSGANRYVHNTQGTAALTAFEDALADVDVGKLEASTETGDILESLAPPPATIIISTQDRLFLAGISDNPYAVWYSRLRGDSEVASFHDALVVEVPPTGGPITGLAFLNETLVVFCETAIFALAGDGFGNVGSADGSRNYGPARLLSSDVGAVNHESIALTPLGLIFKSSKGWQLLNGGWQVQYIGGKAADFDDATVAAVHVMEATHQVRIVLANSAVLVWDYKSNEWFEWTEDDAIGAVVWGGTYHLVTSTAVRAEQTSYATVDYAVDVELPWLDFGGRAGYRRIREFQVLGEYRSACRIRVRVAYDYESDGAGGWNWVDDKYFTATPTTVGGPLQVKHGPKYPKGQAIKIRLTLYHATLDQPPAGEGVKFTGITFSVGTKRGPFKGLPAAQKQ